MEELKSAKRKLEQAVSDYESALDKAVEEEFDQRVKEELPKSVVTFEKHGWGDVKAVFTNGATLSTYHHGGSKPLNARYFFSLSNEEKQYAVDYSDKIIGRSSKQARDILVEVVNDWNVVREKIIGNNCFNREHIKKRLKSEIE